MQAKRTMTPLTSIMKIPLLAIIACTSSFGLAGCDAQTEKPAHTNTPEVSAKKFWNAVIAEDEKSAASTAVIVSDEDKEAVRAVISNNRASKALSKAFVAKLRVPETAVNTREVNFFGAWFPSVLAGLQHPKVVIDGDKATVTSERPEGNKRFVMLQRNGLWLVEPSKTFRTREFDIDAAACEKTTARINENWFKTREEAVEKLQVERNFRKVEGAWKMKPPKYADNAPDAPGGTFRFFRRPTNEGLLRCSMTIGQSSEPFLVGDLFFDGDTILVDFGTKEALTEFQLIGDWNTLIEDPSSPFVRMPCERVR